MTKTENYNLPQWAANDPLRREDFNGAMESIDAGLETKADQTALEAYRTGSDAAVAALDSRLTNTGGSMANSLAQAKQELTAAIAAAQATADAAYSPDHPSFVIGSYVGDGGYRWPEACSVTVGFPPRLLIVAGSDGKLIAAPRGIDGFGSVGRFGWTETGVAWSSDNGAAHQLNTAGETYYYAVFR